MPNRMLREGIIDSRKMGSISDAAKVFYYKLISVVDDFGRYESDPELLRRRLYSWETDRVCANHIEHCIAECSSGEDPLIRTYSYGKKRYLELVNFRQQIRSKSKFPDDKGVFTAPLKGNKADPKESCDAPDNSCEQVRADALRSDSTRLDSTRTVTNNVRTLPYHEPTKAEVEEFSDWCEARYAKHPKKKDKYESLRALQKFCRDPASRALFERNHDLYCETPEWREKGGNFTPKLWEFIEDDGWKYPPIQPSKQQGQSRGRGLMLDLVG